MGNVYKKTTLPASLKAHPGNGSCLTTYSPPEAPMLNRIVLSDKLCPEIDITASCNPDEPWTGQASINTHKTQELTQPLGDAANAITGSWMEQWLDEEALLDPLPPPQELEQDEILGDRYEVLDGTLLTTPYPCWSHQEIAGRLFYTLDSWARSNHYGRVAISPCLKLGDGDRLMPDVTWISPSRFNALIDSRGQLTGVPELVVEVLSPSREDERCDRQLKFKIYSREGVKEYWIVDPIHQQIQVYCRQETVLALVATYQRDEAVESHLLPNCIFSLDAIFA